MGLAPPRPRESCVFRLPVLTGCPSGSSGALTTGPSWATSWPEHGSSGVEVARDEEEEEEEEEEGQGVVFFQGSLVVW